MYTKPCARATCQNLCRVGSRRRLDEAKYCSKPCAYLGRAESGWRPVAHFTQAQRQAAGRKGGTAASAAKRKRACERAVGPLDQVLRRTLLHVRADLTARDLAPLTALLAQAYHVGYERGYQTGWTRTNRTKPELRAFLEQAKRTAA